ncbi:response regulator [Rhodanobacter sp. BL-MT-08]
MAAPAPPIRVLVVDDHPLLREGIVGVVNSQPDMLIVGEASDGLDAIEHFRKLRPDVTLMDLQMPGMDGLEAITILRKEFADAIILVLTTYKGDVQALRAIKAGAQGYLLKGALRKELVDTIRNVFAGHRYILPEVASDIAAHLIQDALTERETVVLSCVAAGNSNKLVAQALCITEETVKGHMKSIMAKLAARDRTHAVAIAMRRGIITM